MIKKNKLEVLAFTLLLLSSLFLIFFTKDNVFFSDDFEVIFSLKLFNLINGEYLSIANLFKHLGPGQHYAPLFLYFMQFMPTDVFLFHCIIVFSYGLTAYIIFLISKEIFGSQLFSLVTSLLYFYNMSINGWALTWNVWGVHIIVSLTSLAYFYFGIKFLKKEKFKNKYLIFFIMFSFLSIFNYESSFLFVTLFLIYIFFTKSEFKKKFILTLLISIMCMTYFYMAFKVSGVFHPLLDERLNNKHTKNFMLKVGYDPDDIYFLRSNYAERNLKNYTLRTIENSLNSINLGVIEHILKSNIDKEKRQILKKFINNNIQSILIFTISFLAVLAILSIKFFHRLLGSHPWFFKMMIVHFFMIILASVIFFRKDLNMISAFTGSLLISYFITIILNKKKAIISLILCTLYFLPSLIYIAQGMQISFGDYDKKIAIQKSKNIDQIVNLKKIENLEKEYKYYYFYKNYLIYESSLKKYKYLDYKNFSKKFSSD